MSILSATTLNRARVKLGTILRKIDEFNEILS